MRAGVAIALVVASVLAWPAPGAHAKVAWLCHPSMASDPCHGDLTTTYFEPDGSSHVATPAVPATLSIDCFYVSPTVSNQPPSNATQTPGPEVRSIALYQAGGFSTQCRVFAPRDGAFPAPPLTV